MEQKTTFWKFAFFLLLFINIFLFSTLIQIPSAYSSSSNVTRCARDLSCSTSEFCEFPTGVCGGGGSCTFSPEACTAVWQPVCGCDLNTYSNDCERQSAEVSKLHDGECSSSSCLPHRSTACFDNDVYWYNSCGIREEQRYDCGKDSCGLFEATYCKNGSVYANRSCFHRGCSENSCFISPFLQELLVQDCGGAGCNSATVQCNFVQVCGNKITEIGEQCDDGNANNNDACTNLCQYARCGDGILKIGEQCDDGNTISGDGCSSTCKIETIKECKNFCKITFKENKNTCKINYKNEIGDCINKRVDKLAECNNPVGLEKKSCVKDAKSEFKECKKDAKLEKNKCMIEARETKKSCLIECES